MSAIKSPSKALSRVGKTKHKLEVTVHIKRLIVHAEIPSGSPMSVAFERGKKLLSTNEVNITEGGCDIDEKIVLPITLYSTRQKGFEAKRAKLLVRRKVAATAAPQQPTHVVIGACEFDAAEFANVDESGAATLRIDMMNASKPAASLVCAIWSGPAGSSARTLEDTDEASVASSREESHVSSEAPSDVPSDEDAARQLLASFTTQAEEGAALAAPTTSSPSTPNADFLFDSMGKPKKSKDSPSHAPEEKAGEASELKKSPPKAAHPPQEVKIDMAEALGPSPMVGECSTLVPKMNTTYGTYAVPTEKEAFITARKKGSCCSWRLILLVVVFLAVLLYLGHQSLAQSIDSVDGTKSPNAPV